MAKEYLSIPEAAIVLGLSRIAVFKQVKKGKLPAIRIGRNWAVPVGALTATDLPGGKLSQRAVPPPAVSSPPPHGPGGDRGFEDMGWD
jgi:excisionase family DNA binding protein